MSALAHIRRNRRSGGMLGLVLVAWLGVLVTPCANAVNANTSATALQNDAMPAGVHHDCAGSTAADSMDASDCCCELDELLSTKPVEPRGDVTVAGMPATDIIDQPCLAKPDIADCSTVTRHATFPPIYLTTQRLRI